SPEHGEGERYTLATGAPMIHALPLLLCAFSSASDWPQYNGPSGDRTTKDTLGLRAFGASGPPSVWKIEVGAGFSSFAVQGGCAYPLVLRDGNEVLSALDAANGKELWSAPLSAAHYDGGGDSGASGNEGGDGPRSTPSVADGRVLAFDAQLVLYAFEAAGGK